MIDRRTLNKGAAAAIGAAFLALSLDSCGQRDKAAPSEPGDLHYASVDDLIGWFKAAKVSPVDLLNAQIKRVEALNDKVNCITDEHFDTALKEAKESEQRYRQGDPRPLEGITVAMKDEFARPGWRVTQGSLIYKDSPRATENDAIVDALEAAGAVMPFQTTVPEFYLFLGASTRAWGTAPQSLEPRVLPRGVVGGIGGGTGRGLFDAGHGFGHGRLDSHSGIPERPVWIPPTLRPRCRGGGCVLDSRSACPPVR